MVTREALRVLHQKLNFIGSINRAYDDQFAKTGAKIGNTLKIRLPNQSGDGGAGGQYRIRCAFNAHERVQSGQ
jgi:hypothetical protein